MKTTECVRNRLKNGGSTGRAPPPDSDEIHLNVMTISVCSPPGCIFVKEEKDKKKKRTEYVKSSPPVVRLTSAVGRGRVKQCVPYLKNEAFIGTCLHIIIRKP